jgi:hypothetical protein
MIDELKPMDVICGRGMNTSVHPGNVAFKKVMKKHEMEYICAKRSTKPKIAMKLLEDFRRHSVRFVKRERDGQGRFMWFDIGEQRAYEKVCQSLREGAPQLRRQMLASQAIQERQDTNTYKDTVQRTTMSTLPSLCEVSIPSPSSSSPSRHHPTEYDNEERDLSPVTKTPTDDNGYRTSKESYYYHPYSVGNRHHYNHHYNCPPSYHHHRRGEDEGLFLEY